MKNKSVYKLFPICIGLVFCIFGCIPVEDIGNYWEQGKLDPKIEGHWKKTGVEHRSEDEYLSFIKSKNCYSIQIQNADEEEPSDEAFVKTIVLGEYQFLIWKDSGVVTAGTDPNSIEEEQNNSGWIMKYKLLKNKLTLYFLDSEILKDAIEKGQIKGGLNGGDAIGPSIRKLDTESIKWLTKIANQKKSWKAEEYIKIENLEEALKHSRSYPATKKTRENATVDVNLPDLQYFAEGKTDIFLRYLKASSEWKVFEERGEIICYKRVLHKSGEDILWQTSRNGYEHNKPDIPEKDQYQIRYLFRFSEDSSSSYNSWADTTKVGPTEGKIQLKLKSDDQGIESYLVVGQQGLWFEFFEQSNREKRVKTREALQWIEEYLKNIRKYEKEIQQKGFASKLMPQQIKIISEIKIEEEQWGIYNVYAWINPGKEGYIYLKVFNADTNERLSEESISESSEEYIGWSDDPSVLFFSHSLITIYEGDWEDFYDAKFELWFHPEDGSAEAKLLETTFKVCGWEN